VELFIRHLGECRLRPSSINTMMHGIRGYFRCAHIDGLTPHDPAVYARLPKVHQDETPTQGLDRLELIRFLQVAQTISVHHGALAFLLGINALRAPEAAAVKIEDYRETLRGHRVLHLVGKSVKPATMPLTVPVLRVLPDGRTDPTPPRSPGISDPTRCAKPRSPTPWTQGCRCATPRSTPATPTRGPPSTTTEPAATSTVTACTSSPPTSGTSEI
jgi:hypothetical protein